MRSRTPTTHTARRDDRIRAAFLDGASVAELVRRHGLTQPTIERILRGPREVRRG